MGRDKARDDKYFSCSDQHEIEYVVRQYDDRDGVRKLLKDRCVDKTISYSTNLEVYKIIEKELGYKIPVNY